MTEHKSYNDRLKISVFTEILIYFIFGTLIIGAVSYVTITNSSARTILDQKEKHASSIFKDLNAYLDQFEGIAYILEYWIENGDNMDVEYEADDETRKKMHELLARKKNLSVMDSTEADIKALSPEDQKLFAEIVFNRVLMHTNHIKTAYDIDYVYVMATDDKFNSGIFLASGNDGSKPRSSKFGDAYTLGTTVTLTDEQVTSLKETLKKTRKVAESEGYADSYETYIDIPGYHVFLGIAYQTSDVKEEIRVETIRSTLRFVLLQMIFAAICLFLIRKNVLKPLKKVQKSVESYDKNKDSNYVVNKLSEISLGNEIGHLADSFSKMVLTVDQYIDEVQKITAEKERISVELGVATKIQKDMLPREFPPFPDRNEFDIFATMNPAKEVGGDFYDFFLVDDDHLALVMADVSGKGVPAALFMVIAKTLIKTRTLAGGTPSEILYDVNNQLCEGNDEEFFVTVWLSIIEISTGKGVAANAGHEHPILRRKNCEFEPVIYKHSSPLGMIEGIKYIEHEFKLDAGDALFEYTDGVTEAENKRHELFGMDNTVKALNKCKEDDPQKQISTVREEINNFVGDADQFDDITMMAFYYKG
ncbi:SpoIIE family protein phosphatase [Butyrivibrio sp. LC3010]|uniref:SpoIIE family protein phosphatase n=1 Tax=Butyrivibrio sp. LC3010 TaxID=1280680 RepID=UPI000424BBC0|nr:PP2C family protein-serine/threonine phosphatase [Butyrivibrio sp. LC3010]